ncbi:MAG: TOBE domain-containing protein [Alphaproteobacteria bacterium]|nr:TOBE domain-containing protein [Alphaproteobacteria bacterium]
MKLKDKLKTVLGAAAVAGLLAGGSAAAKAESAADIAVEAAKQYSGTTLTVIWEGSPLELYERPVNKFVAGFLGSPAMNFIPATIEANGDAPCFRLAGDLRLALPAARAGDFNARAARQVLLGIRPEHMHRQREGAPQAGFEALPVGIEIVEPMGANTLINFHIGKTSVLARLDAYADEQPGEELTLLIDMNRAVVVDPDSEAVI